MHAITVKLHLFYCCEHPSSYLARIARQVLQVEMYVALAHEIVAQFVSVENFDLESLVRQLLYSMEGERFIKIHIMATDLRLFFC